MANGSHTGQKGSAREQTPNRRSLEQLENMPMNHYVHPIPQYREACEGCCRIRELLECQARLQGEILAVLDKMAEKQDT